MRYIALFALVLIFAALTYEAKAQEVSPCGPREGLVQNLTEQHGETVLGMGIRTGGPASVVELWVGRDGNWTIVQSFTDGVSCVRASGTDWSPATVSPDLPRTPA